jgi:hypothetical protein
VTMHRGSVQRRVPRPRRPARRRPRHRPCPQPNPRPDEEGDHAGVPARRRPPDCGRAIVHGCVKVRTRGSQDAQTPELCVGSADDRSRPSTRQPAVNVRPIERRRWCH